MFFEEIVAGTCRFTSNVGEAMGIIKLRAPDEHGTSVHVKGIVKPDPPDLLPHYGTYPRGEKLQDHVCAKVPTYFSVRTKNYLKDRIKARSDPRMFEFIGSDVLRGPVSARDICAHPDGIMNSPQYQALYKAAKKASMAKRKGSFRRPASATPEASLGDEAPPFIFAVNFALPKAPSLAPNEYVNFVLYFARRGRSDNEIFENLWDKFCGMSPAQRSARLKLIPVIVNGPKAFQQTVANRPAIIGNKLKATWYESENHMEVIVDVGTSMIATQVWKMMLPQSKHLAMDIAWVIEGLNETELPEVVLGCCHLSKPDLNKYRTIIPQTQSRSASGMLF